jgi:hypothetical protein
MLLRWLLIGVVLLLAGCVAPRQIEKARTDMSVYRQQQRAKDIRERCIDGGAMPGTPAYLECQLNLEKSVPAN